MIQLEINNMHKELVPDSTGFVVEKNAPNGYHYELQYLNGLWQWLLVKDNVND